MLSNKKIYSKFSKEVKRLENRIEHRKLYNVFNLSMKILIKTGIAIDYALPFIVSAIIISNVGNYTENKPFIVDDVTIKSSVQTIDTSFGYHFEKSSFDYKYNDESIEYSTGWRLNDDSLYERTSTSYRLKDIDLNDTKSIFSMTEEQLKERLVVTNVKTITKSELDEEDYLYSEDGIIVINHYESDEDTLIRNESTIQNIANSSSYLFLSMLLGGVFTLANKFCIKISIGDKLRIAESHFNIIQSRDIDDLKQELELSKNNLEMLSTEQTDNIKRYSKLRKEYKKEN